MRHLVLLAFVLLAGNLSAQQVFAMATEEIGNEPLNKLNYAAWKGIMPLINDKTRVYTVWVNGNENFYYQGSTKELNAALANFAKIEAETHIVVLRTGPASQKTFHGKTPIPYNWRLHVLGGLAGHGRTNKTEDLEWRKDPVLTVQIDETIHLDQLKIPAGVTVRKIDSADAVKKKLERFLDGLKDGAKK